jgi:predicted DNA-binding transcriptional regulator AlpA
MPEQFAPRPMTAAELGAVIGLSRARIYQLVKQGRFPGPCKSEYSTRSFFSAESVDAIMKIKRNGIAIDGRPIVFNRGAGPRKKVCPKVQSKPSPISILEYLEGLGLAVPLPKLERVLAELYPEGWEACPQEEVVQKAYQVLLADSQ